MQLEKNFQCTSADVAGGVIARLKVDFKIIYGVNEGRKTYFLRSAVRTDGKF